MTFRLLVPGDAPLLAEYFRGLSAATRAFFGPHPLDDAGAAHACADRDPRTLRIAGVEDGAIVAYAILLLGVTEHEAARFRDRGLPLDDAVDATIAPSVADAFQGRGVGRALMEHAVELAAAQGRSRIVLLGGVQAANVRAVRLYERLGFARAGEFEHPPGCVNLDMIRPGPPSVIPARPSEVTLYHNPRCSKSRAVLALLRGHGVEPRIVDYLATSLAAHEVLALARQLGVTAHDIVRTEEDEYAAAGLSARSTDADVARAIAEHPVLLQRPIVLRGDRGVVGRPPERALELLA